MKKKDQSSSILGELNSILRDSSLNVETKVIKLKQLLLEGSHTLSFSLVLSDEKETVPVEQIPKEEKKNNHETILEKPSNNFKKNSPLKKLNKFINNDESYDIIEKTNQYLKKPSLNLSSIENTRLNNKINSKLIKSPKRTPSLKVNSSLSNQNNKLTNNIIKQQLDNKQYMNQINSNLYNYDNKLNNFQKEYQHTKNQSYNINDNSNPNDNLKSKKITPFLNNKMNQCSILLSNNQNNKNYLNTQSQKMNLYKNHQIPFNPQIKNTQEQNNIIIKKN